MQTVRTTVTLPKNVYSRLRTQSFKERKTFGQVIADWSFERASTKTKKTSVEEDMVFFEKVGASGKDIDMLKALREDRDR
ncbi:MAG: hypothetical protein ABFQ62_04940 [Patescibacteria group bacterium]